MRRVVAVVFCDPPRPIPHARLLSVIFRTVHLAAFGLLLGGHAFGVPPERLMPSLWLTVGSGLLLMGLETAASARWLLEGRGLTVAPVRMRHIYTQGGGIHCATLDTVRDSKLESYFD